MNRFFIFGLLISLNPISIASAQEDAPKVRVESQRPVKIDYRSPSWNRDPNKADSSTLIIRDAISGKLAKLNLEETGPNTGDFSGHFSLGWAGGTQIIPEIYQLPRQMVENPDAFKKLGQMIQDGVLFRKPLFFRVINRTQQISVFDNKQQALDAFETYRKNTLGKAPVDPAALEAQRKAQMLAEQQRLADLAKQQELERQKLEEAEKRRKEELKRQQAMMDAAEKARRAAQAKKLAEQAMVDYQGGKYAEAEKKFAEAVELDPTNSTFYFQYGVTLYQTGNHNKSLVVLESAKGGNVNEGERVYFMGLNHMKQKEYESAYSEFQQVKNMNSPAISGPAAFFAGIIDFQREKYDEAQAQFEYVLDNSSDAQLDQQAENYIDQISNIKAFQEEAKKRFLFGLNLGLIYDSNILSVANNQLDQATGLDGYRWMYGGTAEWRPVYNMNHEFSIALNASDMYSQDSKFQAKTEFQNTDPLLTGMAAKYKYKGLIGTKPYQMGLTPSLESISMNADGSGAREAVLSSQVLKWENTFVMTNDYFAAYNLEYRIDKSHLEVAAGQEANDSNATKTTVSTSQTFFQDQKKTKAWIGDFSYAMNNAKGDDQKNNKWDLGLTYMAPGFSETVWTARLGYGTTTYGSHSSSRVDKGSSLNLGLSKPLATGLTAIFSGNYTLNDSNLEANQYKKYSVTSMLSWNTSL